MDVIQNVALAKKTILSAVKCVFARIVRINQYFLKNFHFMTMKMKTKKMAQTILTIGIIKETTLICIILTFIMLTFGSYISLVRLI